MGALVPKRHARRAVTRSLVKRVIRQAFQRRAAQLTEGAWVVRLRQPFALAQFPSARSQALALAVHEEVDRLLAEGLAPAGRTQRAASPRPTAARGTA